MPGKTRRWGRFLSKTPIWKKAVVTLVPGDRIEFFEGV
jgi:large subunit ribosomal protein L23